MIPMRAAPLSLAVVAALTLAAQGLDFLDHFECGIGVAAAIARAAQIVDHDLGSAPCKFKRIGAANSAASAGDNGHAAFEGNAHATQRHKAA